MIADRDEERGCYLAEALGSQASFIRTDVASGPETRAVVEHAVRRFGRLDIMFNNAGFGGARDGIAELTEEGWDATMAVLLRAVFLGIKHAAASVIKPQHSSVILSTASAAGLNTAWSTPHIYNTARLPLSSSPNRSRSSWASTVSGSTAYALAGSRHRYSPAASTCRASYSTRCRT
jgi:NAD(P)-dependent dehydrogenase (short-subunit alcohol dehydrogenase family)